MPAASRARRVGRAVILLLVALTFVSAGESELPPIPPLPPSTWPSAEVAEPFARELLAR